MTRDAFDGFGAYVRRVMRRWQVPGLSVAVVRNGRVAFADGFGFADVGRGVKASAETVYSIGSISKSFTTTALGILADEGRLTFDTPVRKLLPGFRLHDRVATERATLRDLLCHRTGMPRHDNAWYGLRHTRKSLLARLKHLRPTKGFRAEWQYQNLMFMAAGMVVEAVSGQSWEAFVDRRVLRPMGMTATDFGIAEAESRADFARPHQITRGRARRTTYYDLGPLNPAGGINSTVLDLAKWMTMNLAGGKAARRRIVSAGTLRAIHTPQMIVPGQPAWPELGQLMYALSWNVLQYRGERAICHGGLVHGFQAICGMLPRRKAGVVVLTDLMLHPTPTAILYNAFDRLLGLKPLPWPARLAKAAEKLKAAEAAARRKAAREAARTPAARRALARYAGRYRHPGYGLMIVRPAGKELQVEWNGLTHRLIKRRGDTFILERRLWNSEQPATFSANESGEVTKMAIVFEATTGPIVFRRVG